MVSQDVRRQPLQQPGVIRPPVENVGCGQPIALKPMSGRITIFARHFRRSTNSSISGWRPWKARCTRSPWRMRGWSSLPRSVLSTASSGCTDQMLDDSCAPQYSVPRAQRRGARHSLSFFVSEVSQELGPILLVILAFYCTR
jgi:hypothetical protein